MAVKLPPSWLSIKLVASSLLMSWGTLFIAGSPAFGQQYTIVLKNGMILGPGTRGEIAGLNESSLSPQQQSGPKARFVTLIDDGLRETFFHTNMMAGEPTPGAASPMTITLQNAKRVARSERTVIGINRSEVTAFNKYGRRTCRVSRAGGAPLDLLQGITEVTPLSLRVESMKIDGALEWDTRISLNSIDPELLKTILLQNADLSKEQDWLDIVSLLRQAKHYSDAIDVLKRAIKAIPEMEGKYKANFTRLEQDLADQMFAEVTLRRKAAQYQLADALLRGFELKRLTDETKIKIEKRIADNQAEQIRFQKLITLIEEQLRALSSPEIQAICRPVVEEIKAHLTPSTIDRLLDFERLQADTSLSPEKRVALAVGGWLLGSGNGIEDITLAKALIESRKLVQEYMATEGATGEFKRKELLTQLKKSEANSCRYIAPMLAKALPSLPLPEPHTVPGRFLQEISVPQLGGEKANYVVQLPPEYDPYRAYPCVVALASASGGEMNELNWWVGDYNETYQRTMGEASRNGYVVICPKWRRNDQSEYEYTENEHARVLACMRDAMRRINIDNERVFIGGHYSGGDAAWDIAQAHPDLWAGLICIGAGNPEGYIEHYVPNGKYLPMYFVHGAIDGAPQPLARCGKTLDKYIQSSKNDFLYVSYPGRGKDYFVEELPRIMEWMNLASHVRLPFPEEIDVRSTRPGDNFFWWLNIDELNEDKGNLPLLQFDHQRVAELEANLKRLSNLAHITRLPARRCSLLLHPSMVDFDKKLTVTFKGDRKSYSIEPDVETLLEDARRRADRQRPYWARLEIK